MSKHKRSGTLRRWIGWAKIQRYYLLNQWHYFKKPKLKQKVKEAKQWLENR